VQRDLAAEEAAVAEVKAASEALRFSLQTDTYQWELSNPAACLQFLLEIKPLLEDQKLVLEWPKGEKIRLTHQADLSQLALKVRSRRDWFELEGELRLDDKLVLSLKELLKAVKHAQGDFVEVSEGQYLALTRSLRRHLEKLGGVTFEEGEKQKFSRLAAASLEDVLEEAGALETSKAWRDTVSRMREARDLLFHLPSTFKAELRPYQQEGFQWLMRLAHWQVGACLADDMGLGKTIQALAAILARAELGPAMVVAPASVVRNWRSECERFAPTLNPIIFGEGDRAETMRQLGPYDLLLVSYGLLPSEAERLTEAHFATLVLDEAQAIKNRATKRSRVAMQLQADFRIATTGTPIENHLGELHNLFRFLNPGLLGTQKQFQEQFAIPIERNRDEERQKHLRQLIRPFVLRRRKSEVLEDLPPKTEISLSIDLSSEEMALYEAIRQEALESLADADLPAGQQHLQILAQLTRMRQACCHPQLINPKLKFDSAKLRVFDEIVEELRENGHKALIFSQFVSYLKLIEKRVKAKGIPYQYLDGSTPSKQREKRIQAFQRGEGDLFLISLKAGGTGINLTAADYVIHMDPWWNPAVEDQASDRAHRIGQNRPVTIYRLVTAQTIEEKIVRLHHEKRELADSLLSGTDLSAKLNAEELLALIREG
jgi:SNF2 family DNA or RNA helicase